MKSAILVKSKKPLVIDEVMLPKELEFGQVLVKIFYSGICGSQINEIDSIKETPKAESNDDEHKFYHGTSKIESGVTRRGTSKKRTKKKGKPPGHIKNWTNV